MAHPGGKGEEEPRRWGYTGAIAGSAALHALIIVLVLVVLPGYFAHHEAAPPSYTVKIVDSIPAGDLGSHLPRLDTPRARPPRHPARPKPKPEVKPPPRENHPNEIALNTWVTPTPTPTPRPTPRPTPAPRAAHRPHHRATPQPTPRRHHRPRPTPTPRPRHTRRRPKTIIVMAEEPAAHHRRPTARPTPGVSEQLARVRRELMAEHLREQRRSRETEGGPVLASRESEGKGYGVGAGEGSAGIQQQVDFLLYYHTVQKKIRAAWTFSGGNDKLNATVLFQINSDGTLGDVRIKQSSEDPAFDESVIRAIKRAAPFLPPPRKYQAEFSQGIEANFTLGELKSS